MNFSLPVGRPATYDQEMQIFLLFPDVEQKPMERARAFAVAAPNLWNGLPATTRNIESLSVF